MNLEQQYQGALANLEQQYRGALTNLERSYRKALHEAMETIRDLLPLRFSAVAYGIGYYPEDEEIWGCYERTEQRGSDWEVYTFESAIRQMPDFVQGITALLVDDDDDDCLKFEIGSVQIVDQHGRVYLTGKTNNCGQICWEALLATADEIKKVFADARELSSQSSFESGWDNHSTARRLNQSAHAMSAIAEASQNNKYLVREGDFEFCYYVKQVQP